MKRFKPYLTGAALLIAGTAYADTRCAVPMTDWQPRGAVVRLADQNGWNVRRIKIDDGCYEIIGTDARGRQIEVKIHPGTLAVVKLEYHGDEDEHDDHKDRTKN